MKFQVTSKFLRKVMSQNSVFEKLVVWALQVTLDRFQYFSRAAIYDY